MAHGVESLERRALLSGGQAVGTFGSGGVAAVGAGTTDFGAFTKLAAGPGGTLYAAGGPRGAARLLRVTADGTPDPSFGGTGSVAVPGRIEAVTADRGGGVYVASLTNPPDGSSGSRTLLTHVRADGSVDTAWGTAGTVTLRWDAASNYALVGWLGLDSAGRLTAAGGDLNSFAAARFDADGTFDTTYAGGTGVEVMPLHYTGHTEFFDLTDAAFAPDGGLVMVASTSETALIARLTPAGAPDTTFGDAHGQEDLPSVKNLGYLYMDDNGDTTGDVAVDSAGRVLLGGQSAYGVSHAAVVRLLPGGAVDPSFGTGGAFNGPSGDFGGMALQPGDGVVVAGYGTFAASTTLTGVTPWGGVDPTFGDGGSTTLNGAYEDMATAGDGSVALAGFVNTSASTSAGALAEVSGSGPAGSVTGRVFRDADGDGLDDDAAPPAHTLASVTVYLDYNGNGTRDAGEPSTVTADDGTYTLANLYPTTYAVGVDTSGLNYSPVTNRATVTVAPGQATAVAPFGVVPTLTARGYVFRDTNANGVQDAGESALAGYTVYVDANANGALDAGEPRTATTSLGYYAMKLPGTGTYRLGLVLPDATRLTGTNGPVSSLTLASSTLPVNFGTLPLALVYVPVAGTDKTPASGLSTVYVDQNNDGVRDDLEPAMTVTTNGEAYFYLAPGPYTLRLLPKAGYTQTLPAAHAGLAVQVGPTTQRTVTAGFTIAAATTGTVTGTVFNDANGNGVQDAGEANTGFSQVAYLDLNGDGRPDANEPKTYVPVNGTYAFQDVAPGTYTVRLSSDGAFAVRPTAPAGGGQPVTVAAGQTATVAAFGLQPVVYYGVTVGVFADADGNGVRDAGEAFLGGRAVYADLNDNGTRDAGEPSVSTSAASPTTLSLEAGTYVLREVVPAGEQETGRVVINAATASAFAASGTVRVSQDTYAGNPPVFAFGVRPVPQAATAAGVVFDDANKNGKQDAGEAGLAGVTVYVDADNDKTVDANERSTVTLADGSYSFAGLADTGAATRLRAVVPAGSTQVSPANGYGYALTLTPGATNAGLTFGLYTPPPAPTTATLSGFAFDDKNGNGVYDTGETKTAGKTVFLDANGNGAPDAGEASVVTGTGGAWAFGGLAAGTYHVRRIFPPGYAYSTRPVDATVVAGQTVSGLAIGSKAGPVTPPANTGSITGYAFDDANGDGKFGTGDKYTSGKTLFLDTDNDGVLDPGEKSVLTDGTGKFAFTGLAAGTYHVRRVFASGYTYSTAKPDPTLSAGQGLTGLAIGTKKA